MRPILQGLDVGAQREKNEDFVLVDENLRLGIVADGVGGHRGGDRAARLTAETVHQMLKDQAWAVERVRGGDRSVDPEDIAKVVRFALNRAAQTIHREAETRPELRGMSTTCTLLLDLGDRALIAHIGDSRAYVVRDGQVIRVTEDHVVAIATGNVNAGKPVKERVLSRALGTTPDAAVDVLWMDLRPNDFMVLCSDGLSDQLANDEEVGEVLESFGPEASPEVFVDLANVRGGPDNIAVIVFGQEPGHESRADIPPWSETKAQLKVLRALKPFQPLSYFELEILRPHVRVDMYQADTAIEPETPTIAVVARGKVELEQNGLRTEIGAGGLIGETVLTTRREWPYRVRALEQTVLLVMSIDHVTMFIAQRPFASTRLLWTFLSTASDRYLHLSRRVKGRLSAAPGPRPSETPSSAVSAASPATPRSAPPLRRSSSVAEDIVRAYVEGQAPQPGDESEEASSAEATEPAERVESAQENSAAETQHEAPDAADAAEEDTTPGLGDTDGAPVLALEAESASPENAELQSALTEGDSDWSDETSETDWSGQTEETRSSDLPLSAADEQETPAEEASEADEETSTSHEEASADTDLEVSEAEDQEPEVDEEEASDADEEEASDADEEEASDADEEEASDADEEEASDADEEEASDADEEEASDADEEEATDADEEDASDGEEDERAQAEQEEAPSEDEAPIAAHGDNGSLPPPPIGGDASAPSKPKLPPMPPVGAHLRSMLGMAPEEAEDAEDGEKQTPTIPPPAAEASGQDDEEQRGTIPPAAPERRTEPPPEGDST